MSGFDSTLQSIAASLAVLIQVAGLTVLIALIVYLAKRITALDAEMRAHAIRETRIDKLPGVGWAVTVADRVGVLRWRAVCQIEREQAPAPQPVLETILSENGEQRGVIVSDDPRRKHAMEVLLQTRQHPDYGDRQQIIPANLFAGSNETWQAGVDFMKLHFGVIAIVGRGTYCGPDHATISHLLRAVTADTPLPRTNGNGSIQESKVK
jgi:hypothetical protein